MVRGLQIVGRKLAELRRSHGWSQEELARISGVTRTALARYEAYDARANLGRARSLATALEMTYEAFAKAVKPGPGEKMKEDKYTTLRIKTPTYHGLKALADEMKMSVQDVLDAYVGGAAKVAAPLTQGTGASASGEGTRTLRLAQSSRPAARRGKAGGRK